MFTLFSFDILSNETFKGKIRKFIKIKYLIVCTAAVLIKWNLTQILL